MTFKRTLALSLAGATLVGSLAACTAGAAPALSLIHISRRAALEAFSFRI